MGILEQIFKDEASKETFEEWWYDADVEAGEFFKHDMVFGTKKMTVIPEIIEELPELAPFEGYIFTQNGTSSYNYGWDSYEDIELYRKEQVETSAFRDFKSLLSHLNAEENDMAQEFCDKYIKKTKTKMIKVEKYLIN